MNEGAILWPGFSGTNYRYDIYPIGTLFKPLAGNYVFAQQTRPGFWTPIYIGESDNLGNRLPHHEKLWAAIVRGATHIHAHLNSGTDPARQSEELDLIRRWNPTLNIQGLLRPTTLQNLLRPTQPRSPLLPRS